LRTRAAIWSIDKFGDVDPAALRQWVNVLNPGDEKYGAQIRADAYGATAGSILRCFFGPGHLEARWLEPFGDRLHTTLADFHEQSLSAVAKRMAKLPLLATELR
jgi:hypothetical protein